MNTKLSTAIDKIRALSYELKDEERVRVRVGDLVELAESILSLQGRYEQERINSSFLSQKIVAMAREREIDLYA